MSQPSTPRSPAARAVSEVRAFLAAALFTPVERDHLEAAPVWRRRRIVVAVTLVLGTIALGLALAIQPGDPLFYPATLGVAAVWTAGALASGRLYLGRAHTRGGRQSHAVLQGFLLGAGLLAVFLAGAVVVGRVPVLRRPVDDLLDHARYGSLLVVALITAINGVAEELFFRGAVYAALDRRWNVIGSTALYALSTVFAGVPLLTFAAVAVGLLAAAQRRVTGGVLGPIVTHLTWSLGMLFLLPTALTLGG